MKDIFNIYKPAGKTPLEMIKKIKEKMPEYMDISMTYAGRLDPLAEGVLIILTGDAVYKKSEYIKFDKEYIGEILFGFRTDTFDIMGLPYLSDKAININEDKIREFEGNFSFSFPPFSSYKIRGKRLFQWAREGRLNEIDIPKKTVKIYDIDLLDDYKIETEDILKNILKKIDLVQGDFRQEEIKKEWKELLKEKRYYRIIKIKVSCSAGTYIRSIADELGGALFSLKRTRVGDFLVDDSLKL